MEFVDGIEAVRHRLKPPPDLDRHQNLAIAGLAGLWYTIALASACMTAFALNGDGFPSLFCALYKFPHCMAMVVGSFLLTPLAFTQFDRSLAFSPTLNSRPFEGACSALLG